MNYYFLITLQIITKFSQATSQFVAILHLLLKHPTFQLKNFSRKGSYILLFLFLNLTTLTAQQTVADSLFFQLQATNEDTLKIPILIDLAHTYRSIDPQKTINYGQQVVDLSKSLQLSEQLLIGYREIAIGHYFLGDNKLALDYFEKAIVIAENNNYTMQFISLLNGKGIIHKNLGEFGKAFSCYHRCLLLVEKESTEQVFKLKALNGLHHNIGNIHLAQDDFDIALTHLQKAFTLAKELGDKFKISIVLADIALVYIGKKDYQNGLATLSETLILAEENKDDYLITSVINSLGNTYLKMGDLNLANKYLSKALSINRARKNKRGIPNDLLSLGILKSKEKNYIASNNHLLESLGYFQEMEMQEEQRQIYSLLSQNHAAQGNYKQAFLFQEQSTILHDSLFSQQKNKQILELSTKYETEKKQAENELLLAQQAKNELEIKQKTKMGWLAGLFFVLVSIIASILYLTNQRRKVYNEQLKKEVNLLNENLENKAIIEKQSKKLRLVEQQKNKLFTNIAHEFQTPLNIIQGLSKELIKKDKLDTADHESLGIILRNSKKLSKTTNEILTINLGQMHKISTNFVLFSFPALIQYILPEFQFLAKEKSITLIPPDFKENQVCIYSDLDKVETIIKNLLSNAIKYTANDSIVSIEYQANNLGFHQITVNDNGRGISEEDIPILFDRYFQSNNNKAEGGFGLGLAICKEYIESLNGEIKVRSELGIWNAFTIQFPMANDELLSQQTELYRFPELLPVQNLPLNVSLIEGIAAEPQAGLLIVEDNLDFCKFLSLILEEDYHLAFVHNGEQAINYLAENNPTLILTDWMMPGTDGLELVQYLKFTEAYNHYPILMLSAKNLISDKLKALRMGIDDYLVKPIEAEVLKNRIANLLKLKEERQESVMEFPYLEPKFKEVPLSLSDQNWLMKVEAIIAPLISDFDLNLEQIALLAETNVRQLNRKSKEITGLTAKKYIQEIRYWEARKLLETKVYVSVKAVCYSVGFKDTKHFARRFKERFGRYPSEYL